MTPTPRTSNLRAIWEQVPGVAYPSPQTRRITSTKPRSIKNKAKQPTLFSENPLKYTCLNALRKHSFLSEEEKSNWYSSEQAAKILSCCKHTVSRIAKALNIEKRIFSVYLRENYPARFVFYNAAMIDKVALRPKRKRHLPLTPHAVSC